MNENGEKKRKPLLAFLIIVGIIVLESAVIFKIVG